MIHVRRFWVLQIQRLKELTRDGKGTAEIATVCEQLVRADERTIVQLQPRTRRALSDWLCPRSDINNQTHSSSVLQSARHPAWRTSPAFAVARGLQPSHSQSRAVTAAATTVQFSEARTC
jgi:hypothetical protein